MQVGFAFLVTGLTRAKNAGHMMMMNIAAFAVALLAYYAVGFAFMFGGLNVASLGGTAPLSGMFHVASKMNGGLLGTHGFFLQSHGTYDVGVMVLFLFEVVFMETAGYIIIGAIAERISFAGFLLAEVAMGAVIYPIYGMWMWGGGWLAHLGTGPLQPRPRRGRLRRFRRRPRHRGVGGPRAGDGARTAHRQVQQGRLGRTRSPGTTSRSSCIGTMILLFGWMGFNPGSTLGATDTAHRSRRGQHAARRVRGLRARDDRHRREVRQARHLDVVQRHARRARRDHRAVRVRRAVGRGRHRRGRRHARRVQRRVLRPRAASTTRAARSRCTASTARGACSSVGLFADGTYGAGWNGVAGNVKGLFYGDVGQLGAQIVHVVVGFIWAWGITWLIFTIAKNFMQIRVSAGSGDRGSRHAGVRCAVRTPTSCCTTRRPVTSRPTPRTFGNGATRTVDLERS